MYSWPLADSSLGQGLSTRSGPGGRKSFLATRSILPEGEVAQEVLVGVSGFSYSTWRGKFYPKEAKPEAFLALYAGRLGSVEINSSFYAMPRATVVAGWSGKTGDAFRFSFKAPAQITHVMKLGKGSADVARRFSAVLDVLGAKRGSILFQLPPYAKQDLRLLESFLTDTNAIERRVFEFRHDSWLNDSTYRLLDAYEAGFCIAETEDMKPTFKVTGDTAYFRLRLNSYDERTVESWAKKIPDTAAGAREVSVYLRHDKTGENAVLAESLSRMLRGS